MDDTHSGLKPRYKVGSRAVAEGSSAKNTAGQKRSERKGLAAEGSSAKPKIAEFESKLSLVA